MNKQLIFSRNLRRFLCRAQFTMVFSMVLLLGASVVMAVDVQTVADQVPSAVVTDKQPLYNPDTDLPLSTWVGSGDVLWIKSFPDTGSFITGRYVIMEGGFIVLPILGVTQVSQLSIARLTAHLTSGYAKYIAYPSIQIQPLIHLSLLGGFISPGMYLVNPQYTFASALSAAGGTVRDDGLRLLRWERHGKILATNLTSEVEGKKSLWAMGVKSGDQICVTLRTERDKLQVASFLVSTIVATGTLLLTILVVLR